MRYISVLSSISNYIRKYSGSQRDDGRRFTCFFSWLDARGYTIHIGSFLPLLVFLAISKHRSRQLPLSLGKHVWFDNLTRLLAYSFYISLAVCISIMIGSIQSHLKIFGMFISINSKSHALIEKIKAGEEKYKENIEIN